MSPGLKICMADFFQTPFEVCRGILMRKRQYTLCVMCNDENNFHYLVLKVPF